MQEKQKSDQPAETADEHEKKDDSWSEDQKARSYYYDDSHGYEVFQDDDEVREED